MVVDKNSVFYAKVAGGAKIDIQKTIFKSDIAFFFWFFGCCFVFDTVTSCSTFDNKYSSKILSIVSLL